MATIRFAAAALAVVASAAVSTAAWADDDTRESSYVAALRTCQAKTDPGERLACYDAAVGSIVTASNAGDVRVVDKEEVRETRRKLFGFSLPNFGIFGRNDDDDAREEEEFATLLTTISNVRQTGSTYVVTTAEGAEWQLDEVPTRLMRPRVGQTLEIRSGALSSYFLRINGQKGVKGRRVR